MKTTTINLFIIFTFLFLSKFFFIFLDLNKNLIRDSALYYNISTHLIQDKSYSADLNSEYFGNPVKDNIFAKKDEITAQVPPGYPFFITIIRFCFGDKKLFIILFQILLEVLAFFYMYTTLKESLPQKQLLIFFIMLIAYYPITKFSNLILTESLFMSMTIITLMYYISNIDTKNLKNMLIYGLFAGITSLIRPTPLPLFIIFPFTAELIYKKDKFFFHKKFLLKYFCLLIVIGVILSPWIIRNYNHYERVIPSSTLGGLSLLFTTSERVGGMTGSFLPKVRESEKLNNYFKQNNLNIEENSLNEAELDHYFKQIGIEQLKKNPINYLKNIIVNFSRFWTNLPNKGASLGSYLIALINITMLSLIFVNLKSILRNTKLKLFLIPIIYFTGVHTFIGNSSYRYNLSVMPFVILLSSYSFNILKVKYIDGYKI